MKLPFFVIGGAVLVVTGLLKLLVRPRQPREVGLQRIVNGGTMFALFCVLMGAVAMAVGLGVLPLLRL